MVVRYRTKGFVFKKNDRLETGRLFSVFTEDFGRVEVLGRAIRKIASKLRGGIEIFSLSEIEFIQGKNYKTLTDAILIKKFNNITSNPEKLEIANNIIGALSSLINGQEKDERIWELLKETFKKLNDCLPSAVCYQMIYYYFLWNFLSVLGYLPEVYKCAICQGELLPEELYFSYKEGGVICQKCLGQDNTAKKVNTGIVKIIRIILKKDWQIINKLKIEPSLANILKEVSANYYNYLLSNHSFRNNLRRPIKVIQ